MLFRSSYMFSNVYNNKKVKKDEDLDKVSNIIESLYYYYLDDPKRLTGAEPF